MESAINWGQTYHRHKEGATVVTKYQVAIVFGAMLS